MEYRYSVVIPHYNSAEMLKRMLKSIPEREDLQVIVADDCSKPEEQEKLRQLKHKNLTLLFQKENKGAGAARNLGLSHVEGKWVTFADADDMYAEGAFDILDQNIDDSLDYLCFFVKCVDDETGHEIPIKHSVFQEARYYYNKKNTYNKNLFLYRKLCPWDKIVKMQFIIKNHVRFEESPVNNDVLYNLHISLMAQKFKIIPQEIYIWRWNKNSMTHMKRSKEREFLYYIQAQKRNGFYKRLGLWYYPFYKTDFLFFFYYIIKRGLKETLIFFKYRRENIEEVRKAKKAYLFLFDK